MKTSNKLLLAAFGLIIAGTIVILIKIKSFVSDTFTITNNDKIELSGEIKEKSYDIKNFNWLKVEGAVSLELSKGESNSISVKADTAILKYLQVDQADNKLIVKLVNIRNKGVRAHVKLTTTDMDIKHLTANAGAKLEVTCRYGFYSTSSWTV